VKRVPPPESPSRCPLRHAARRTPRAAALLEGNRRTDFATLDRQVTALVAALQGQGVSEGQRLLLISEEKGLILRLLLAALRLGACVIPVNPRVPAAQLARQLRHSRAHWLLDPAQALPVAARASDAVAMVNRSLLDRSLLDRSMAAAPSVATQAGEIAVAPQRPLSGVFTSGSSGNPKLALHSYANHYHSAAGSRALIPLGPGDRWALTLPLYHIGGLAILFRCLLAGACVQLPAPQQELAALLCPTAGAVPAPSHLSAVTTQLLRLQAQGVALAAGGLRTLLLGGSGFSQPLLDWLAPQPVRVLISYGLTELSSQVMTGPVNPAGRLAQLLPGRELRLGADGEVLLRGPTLFLGYLLETAVEATAETTAEREPAPDSTPVPETGVGADGEPELWRPLDGDGWFHSRDRGQLDPEGGLRILGRLDNQFISGGENIQPEEIEGLIARYPGVAEAYVVPVADAEYGQRPLAFVAWAAGAAGEGADGAGLQRWLRDQLPGFKVPRAVRELPADARQGLKVSRARLRALVKEPARATGNSGDREFRGQYT